MGRDKCPHYSIVGKLIEKMDHVDGIIVSSTTYNMRGRLYSPSVMLLMPYNLFRGMSLAYVPGTEYETEDGIYWTDEKRRKKVYAPEVKVSWWKKPIDQMFYWIGKLADSMKSMTVMYRK